jgi:four helix bundle protein
MRFENLIVWKRSARLSADLYRHFSGSNDLGFKDQITRSALSIASNIAEGHERASARDRIKFLQHAKGSCGELRTQIYIGIEAGFIPLEQEQKWVRESRELSAMLYGLIRHLE